MLGLEDRERGSASAAASVKILLERYSVASTASLTP